MIERGGRRDIFLGTRECMGYVEPCAFEEGTGFYDHSGELPYGLFYHGITYADEAVLSEDKGQMTVRFWNPIMRNGVICSTGGMHHQAARSRNGNQAVRGRTWKFQRTF